MNLTFLSCTASLRQTGLASSKALGLQALFRTEERGVERGSARRSSLKGQEKAIVNQTNTGTVSTLGSRPKDGVERVWAFPSA